MSAPPSIVPLCSSSFKYSGPCQKCTPSLEISLTGPPLTAENSPQCSLRSLCRPSIACRPLPGDHRERGGNARAKASVPQQRRSREKLLPPNTSPTIITHALSAGYDHRESTLARATPPPPSRTMGRENGHPCDPTVRLPATLRAHFRGGRWSPAIFAALDMVHQHWTAHRKYFRER